MGYGMKKNKKILIIFLIIIICILEIMREKNYVKEAYPTSDFYIENNLKTTGNVNINGNWLTKGSSGTFTTPRVSHFECNIKTNKCIEHTAYKINNSMITATYNYKIISSDEYEIIAARKTDSIKQKITIDLLENSVTIEQESLLQKTGNPYKDIGTEPNISKIVTREEVLKSNYKSVLSLLATPLLYVMKLGYSG